MRSWTGHVPAEAGRLHYERAGRGRTVILIHPWLWDSRVWDDQMPVLSRGYDVIRYDVRGRGRSDPPTGPYSDVQDLLELMVFLDVEAATLVGASMGAALAIDFALANPGMVEALVAVSPTLTGYEWGDPGVGLLGEEIASAVAAGHPERAVDVSLAVWAPLETDPTVDGRIRGIAQENAHAFLIPGELSRPATPAADRLGEIQVATLIVVGEQDLEEIHAIAELLADRIAGAQKRVIAGADHLVNVRAPEKFNRTLLDFLALIGLA